MCFYSWYCASNAHLFSSADVLLNQTHTWNVRWQEETDYLRNDVSPCEAFATWLLICSWQSRLHVGPSSRLESFLSWRSLNTWGVFPVVSILHSLLLSPKCRTLCPIQWPLMCLSPFVGTLQYLPTGRNGRTLIYFIFDVVQILKKWMFAVWKLTRIFET